MESRVLGDYELLSQISSGGMGEVWLARRRGAHGFEKLAALKTIRADMRARESIRTAFLDEAQLVARIDHPAVAQVFDFGESENELFLAMEYVSGVAFTRLLTEPPLRPFPGQTARAMAAVCRGLHVAHELRDSNGRLLNVVHRDVSPQNLMLTFTGHVKILDFGIAWMRGRRIPETEMGTIKGKPAYMSPEQIKGSAIDRRSDIFAVGVVLHEFLTGKRLFRGASVFEVAMAITSKPIPRPSEDVDIPARLDEVVMGCLAQDCDRRIADAAQVGDALDEIADQLAHESLPKFASRVLADDRDEHHRSLRQLTGPGDRPPPRPANEATVRESARVDDKTVSLHPSSPVSATIPDGITKPWRRALFVGVAAAVLALGLSDAVVSMRQIEKADPTPVPVELPRPAATTPTETTPAETSPRPPDTPPERAADASAGAQRRKRRPVAGKKTGLTGMLTLKTEPWTSVTIDGEPYGVTPLFKVRLAKGRHVLNLVNEGKGIDSTRNVVVKPGEHERVFWRLE